VQAYGLIEINVKQLGIDLLTVSSHKINGPKGVGALYVADHINIKTLQQDGNQEKQKRPGTENMNGIIGFSRAVEIMQHERKTRQTTYQQYKKTFIDRLNYHHITFTLNGNQELSIDSIVNISFP